MRPGSGTGTSTYYYAVECRQTRAQAPALNTTDHAVRLSVCPGPRGYGPGWPETRYRGPCSGPAVVCKLQPPWGRNTVTQPARLVVASALGLVCCPSSGHRPLIARPCAVCISLLRLGLFLNSSLLRDCKGFHLLRIINLIDASRAAVPLRSSQPEIAWHPSTSSTNSVPP